MFELALARLSGWLNHGSFEEASFSSGVGGQTVEAEVGGVTRRLVGMASDGRSGAKGREATRGAVDEIESVEGEMGEGNEALLL